jgi:hypothetical protein
MNTLYPLISESSHSGFLSLKHCSMLVTIDFIGSAYPPHAICCDVGEPFSAITLSGVGFI